MPVRPGPIDPATAAKLLDWLCRCEALPGWTEIGARFGCSASQAGRLVRSLEADGSIEVDRSRPYRPRITSVKERA